MTLNFEKIKLDLAPFIAEGYVLLSARVKAPIPGDPAGHGLIILESKWATPKGEKYGSCYCTQTAVNDLDLWKDLLAQMVMHVKALP